MLRLGYINCLQGWGSLRALCCSYARELRARLGLPGSLAWKPPVSAGLRRSSKCPGLKDVPVPRTSRFQSKCFAKSRRPGSWSHPSAHCRKHFSVLVAPFQLQLVLKPLLPSQTLVLPTPGSSNYRRGSLWHLGATRKPVQRLLSPPPLLELGEELAL